MNAVKPWREVAVPHSDVLEGTLLQSEFAADITAVRDGRATREYQDAGAFFERTFITEGMRLLLTQVAQRLNGGGGEPVIQLQTAFGGGKTHTMLAVYHLATRSCSLQDLSGVPALLDQAGMMDVPKARVAILDGTAHAPAKPWKHGAVTINTLWGELAWQLGGAEGLDLVRAADATGTSPGKDSLRDLLTRYAPCVVLIDELVAYVRQFTDAHVLSGGTYDSNLSFVQALTEATKLVPGAIVLASLPESEVEVGSSRGVSALRSLEKTFGRVQSLWKPVATEEAFEIVRRRLFEPIRDVGARDATCRAFFGLYADEGARLPSETHEARYLERLITAYPFHPEVFDRLFEDWTTLEAFQRTRGVLKLMARVIFRLWKDQNKDLMILPGSLPLYDAGARNELVYYLPPGWDAVIEKDIDGDRAEATELDTRETRFGAVHAARRVARTLFLGSAPSSVGTKQGARGLGRNRVLLGCLQPGQSASLYSDGLNRLADRLHYLNASGDKASADTRFWFDTRANLRREMETRKGRFDDQKEVRATIAEILGKLAGKKGLFEGVHVFTPHGDVPDDGDLRLVLLDPSKAYNKQDPKTANGAVFEYLKNNGMKPRFKSNRLVFLAADVAIVSRLRDVVRAALAWGSIVNDITAGRLNIDRLQENQAKKELESAEKVALRVAQECYRWALCPVLHAATDSDIQVEALPLTTTASSIPAEMDRVCEENEVVIKTWSPLHLRARLRELYWKDGKASVAALAVWDDMQRYLYMPRLKSRSVFEQAVLAGVASDDFFGTAYGDKDGTYEGFQLGGANVQVDGTLLLIDPDAAKAYQAALLLKQAQSKVGETPAVDIGSTSGGTGAGHDKNVVPPKKEVEVPPKVEPKFTKFFGSVNVSASTAKMNLVNLADDIVAVLASDPNGTVTITVEINGEFPKGAPDFIRRAVFENAGLMGFKNRTWE